MRPSDAIIGKRELIRMIIIQNYGTNPRIFGSVARGEDDESSDLDLLVDPIPGKTTLISLATMREQVQALIGNPTDVATPGGLKERIRERVLREAIAL